MGINQALFEALQPGVKSLNDQRAENQRAAQEASLRQYLQAKEPEIAGQKQAAKNEADSALADKNIGKVQGLLSSGNLPEGSGVNLGANGNVGVTRGWNPLAFQQQGAHQAQTFLKNAQGAYKDINSNLDASKSTLDALNLGNASGDKMALINEAKLSLNGGRGVPSIVPMLAGDPTMATDGQKALNWLQNTPNIPTLQPAQRDALRETVFARNGQTKQQHQQIASQLAQQGPIVAPQSDYNGIVNSFVTPAQQKIDQIEKMQQDYQAQRQTMQPQNPVSQPATANANPTTLDRLKSFFSGGSQQPAAQPQSMRVKHKASGQTGTIPSNEFDPNVYEQVK